MSVVLNRLSDNMRGILENRLKLILPDIIGKLQSAFVHGRLITDNALLDFQWTTKKKKGKKGLVGKARYHMAKAYDHI